MTGTQRRPRVLTFTDYHSPGFRSGGLVRAVSNLIQELSGDVEFHVVTRIHDLGDPTPYPGVTADRWLERPEGRILYGSARSLSLSGISRLLRSAECDVIYTNSFFSRLTMRLLLLRLVGVASGTPLIIAPRGELAPGTLGLKATRKKLYLALFRALRLGRGATWQASSAHEAADIARARVAEPGRIRIAAEFPSPPLAGREREPKQRGTANIAIVARIARVKNVDLAIKLLREVRGSVSVTIFGPLEDVAYWAQCRAALADLPPTVKVVHRGELPPDDLLQAVSTADLFFLPTRGENFGHAIIEALGAGCPALISDRTAWKGLAAAGAGWDLPLADAPAFQAALQTVVDMDEAQHRMMREHAREYARAVMLDPSVRKANRDIFRDISREAAGMREKSGPKRRLAAV